MVREAESLFHDHLWRVGLKHTGQRDIILRTFLDTHDHLSTDELYRLVKKLDAHIGFTTVYRTLKLLAECGLASEVARSTSITATRLVASSGSPSRCRASNALSRSSTTSFTNAEESR